MTTSPTTASAGPHFHAEPPRSDEEIAFGLAEAIRRQGAESKPWTTIPLDLAHEFDWDTTQPLQDVDVMWIDMPNNKTYLLEVRVIRGEVWARFKKEIDSE